jgi:hypothetical protein
MQAYLGLGSVLIAIDRDDISYVNNNIDHHVDDHLLNVDDQSDDFSYANEYNQFVVDRIIYAALNCVVCLVAGILLVMWIYRLTMTQEKWAYIFPFFELFIYYSFKYMANVSRSSFVIISVAVSVLNIILIARYSDNPSIVLCNGSFVVLHVCMCIILYI